MYPEIAQIRNPAAEEDEIFTLKNGLQEDFACFSLWEGALHKEDEILLDISKHFTVIAKVTVYWTAEHYSRNIQRLYETYDFSETRSRGYSEKIGRPPFRFVIAKDHSPSYTWKRSVSGVIEPSNERVVDAKYRYRGLFDKPYQVHSSNNIEEFLVQASLVLGVDSLEEILGSSNTVEATVHRDLEGAEGWRDWTHLFTTLNPCCRYLVLRNFESVSEILENSGIDFLTDKVQRFASAANVMQHPMRPYKGALNIAGKRVPTAIRSSGDNYFDAQWQRTALERRKRAHDMYVPAKDDHFFSLLYHCKVHEASVKDEYVEMLDALAKEMRLDWFDATLLNDDRAMGRLLAGYYLANEYHYAKATDPDVGRNDAVIRYLPQIEGPQAVFSGQLRELHRLVKAGLRQPHKVPAFIQSRLVLAGKGGKPDLRNGHQHPRQPGSG